MTAYNDAVAGLTTLQAGASGADATTMASVWPAVQASINAMLPADAATVEATPTPGYQDLVAMGQAAEMNSAGYDQGIVHDAATSLLAVVNGMIAAQAAAATAHSAPPPAQPVVVVPPATSPPVVVVQQPAPVPAPARVTVSLGATVMIAIGAILVGGAVVYFFGPELFGAGPVLNPLPKKRAKRNKKRRKSR